MNSQRAHLLAMAVTFLWPSVGFAETREDHLQGTWLMEEKKLLIEFRKGSDAQWTGVIVQAERTEEVGKKAFQKLVYRSSDGSFTGLLLKPEDDSTHDVTVTFTSDDEVKATVKKLFLSKTIILKRQRAPVPQR